MCSAEIKSNLLSLLSLLSCILSFIPSHFLISLFLFLSGSARVSRFSRREGGDGCSREVRNPGSHRPHRTQGKRRSTGITRSLSPTE